MDIIHNLCANKFIASCTSSKSVKDQSSCAALGQGHVFMVSVCLAIFVAMTFQSSEMFLC